MKTQTGLNVVFRGCLPSMALVLALGLSFGNLRGAIWQGGTNYWASDNWGMPDGGYPGDANNPTEPATINIAGSELIIKDGDHLEDRATTIATFGTIRQTGGTWINQSFIRIHERFDLFGGAITGNGASHVIGGGVWNIDGGKLGTRLAGYEGLPSGSGQAEYVVFFYGLGGRMSISAESSVDIHTFNTVKNMNLSDAVAIVETTGVVTSGKYYDRAVLYWLFSKQFATQTAIVRSIFSEEGYTPWWSQGGAHAINFGSGDLRADLEVDVGAYKDRDGTTPHPLLIYRGDMQGDASFGNVKIMDDIYGELVPGEEGDLQPGEYYLNYVHPDASGYKSITLSFRNPPPPAGTLISIR